MKVEGSFDNQPAALAELKVTAAHEWGHRVVGKAREMIVNITSVIRDGSTLGYNILAPNPSRGIKEQFLDGLIAFLGGEAAEEAIGHRDHSGCGSDIFQAWRQAELISRVFYVGQVAAGDAIAWDRSTARSIVYDYGINHLKDRALGLMERQVVL